MNTQNPKQMHDEIDALIHGLLTPEQAEQTRRKIATDSQWSDAYGQAELRAHRLTRLPASEPDEQLIRRTLDRVREESDGERRRCRLRVKIVKIGWSIAAAAAVLVAAFNLYYATLSPSRWDLRLLGQQQLIADAPGSMRVILADHHTGLPVAGVPVRLSLHDSSTGRRVELATLTTNGDGTGSPRFRMPDWPDGRYELRVRADVLGADEVVSRSIELRREWRMMVSTDKPVYQPGQMIRMRTLALRKPDLKPVTGTAAVFTVTDPRGNVIYKQTSPTSRFGIAWTECPLADEILQGQYTVRCMVGQTESRVAVEVKPYVLPKFGVEVQTDRRYYKPDQPVRGTVDARYFFGRPVSDARVRVELKTTRPPVRLLDAELVSTDSNGHAAFEAAVPSNALVGSDTADIAMTVTVTDAADQEHERRIVRTITTRPLRVDLIAESGRLVAGVPNRIYVAATYADGQPAADTQITVTGLERELTTSKLGIASFELTPVDEHLSLSIRSIDPQGLSDMHTVAFEVGSMTGDFIVRPDKAVYRGGQTVNLMVLGGGDEPVFIDLVKDGQTLLTECVDLDNGRGELAIDLPAAVFGTIELAAYRFNNASGLVVPKRRVLYVDQPNTVHISAELDRAEYRPGQSAKLRLTLTDDKGKPAPGAVSLTAVDEAVYHVLGQRPGMEQTFFTLEQNLLKPVHAVYPWAPDLEYAWPGAPVDDVADFERALFARTAKDDGASRNAVLERLVEEGYISKKMLEVLDRDDLDELIAQRAEYAASPRFAQLFAGDNGVHTLKYASYPNKVQHVHAAQQAGISKAMFGWTIVGLFSFVMLITTAILLATTVWTILLRIIVIMIMLLFVAAMLLPSLSRAREVANRTVAATALDSIDKALYLDDVTADRSRIGMSEQASDTQAPVRVRRWFPETLLWRPQVITDDAGLASIDIPLADSITSWRLTASAVTADGRLGATAEPIRVFQPFFVDLNLPVALTRGDEYAVPAVVYNYLDKPQSVALSVERAEWFTLLDEPVKTVELTPNQVRHITFRISVRQVGKHQLQVTARSTESADAVMRDITVEPDGRRVEHVVNGTLGDPVETTVDLPAEAIENSNRTIVKIYPSTFSQLVEGLDSIFQQPYGCFEQTSSTTYPNVLALDYLRRTGQSAPEVEAKARQYIHLGYQRLVSFEVNGGGFDWFGRPPANRTLTAYGLMEFVDMARVHDVDPALIDRTRQWLLKQRSANGSWPSDRGMLNDGLASSTRRGRDPDYATTAYIAWAVFDGAPAGVDVASTSRYLTGVPADQIANPYTLAIVSNALLAMNQDDAVVEPYLHQLREIAVRDVQAKTAHWQLADASGSRTMFYGSGRAGDVETTALATMALLRSGRDLPTAKAALNWLIQRKDANGTWGTTQATVLALRALVNAAGKPLGEEKARRIEMTVNGQPLDPIIIPADQVEVMRQIDLTPYLQTGANTVRLAETTGTGAAYQVSDWHYLPGMAADVNQDEPLHITMRYDQDAVQVGQILHAGATVINRMSRTAPMVIVDLPIPGGFTADPSDFQKLRDAGRIAKYQLTPRSVIVYLRGLEPGKPLQLNYNLRAESSADVTAPPARVYEYYNPDRNSQSSPKRLTIRPPA